MTLEVGILDLIFLIFFFIFVITAFLRGFIKEFFNLFSWIISLFVCYFVAPWITSLIKSESSNGVVIDIIAKFGVFVITFIIISFSTSSLVKALKAIVPTSIDKSLGVFYGILKTLLVFGFIYSLMLNFYSILLGIDTKNINKTNPQWLVSAKSYNIIKYSGEFIDPFVKSFISSTYKNIKNNISKIPSDILNKEIDNIAKEEDSNSEKENLLDDLINKNEDIDKNIINNEAINEVIKNIGYEKIDIEKMNRLIDILNK